jgi:hypothetical protein
MAERTIAKSQKLELPKSGRASARPVTVDDANHQRRVK